MRIHGRSGRNSYPEDKPLESLLDILKLGFRGYRHPAGSFGAFFGEGHIPCADFSGFLGCIVYSAAARSGAKRHNHRIRLWLNNDDNAMKRKIFWICAVALGMSAFPSFMTQATPATQPLINAEPAVAAQAEQNPQVGQVMPGVQAQMRQSWRRTVLPVM